MVSNCLVCILVYWGDVLFKVNNKYGFTLVEMIIVLAVAAIVLTPFGFMVTSGLRNEVRVQQRIDADQTVQQMFIVLNEKIRGDGFDAVSVLETHQSISDVLRVDDKIFFYDDENGYVYQDYDSGSLLTTTEVIMNSYVISAVPNIVLFEDTIDESEHDNYSTEELAESVRLEIVFEVNADGNGSVIETYVFKYAKRD